MLWHLLVTVDQDSSLSYDLVGNLRTARGGRPTSASEKQPTMTKEGKAVGQNNRYRYAYIQTHLAGNDHARYEIRI